MTSDKKQPGPKPLIDPVDPKDIDDRDALDADFMTGIAVPDYMNTRSMQ